ncbi:MULTISPECIES: sulfatase [unclassified Lentimonas]|uniref:sulfatase family protein n=1 Tax=unclassified Lentimonas TaxID=2630993 RepID=UPI001320649C|nr:MULTISPECIES: sulfatase [unclassified Lentimonas]CAA6676295.1 Choline-sulfatase (EC [Lentimonas sp. CC4]CAA6683815.1 Choline-sulfatase (EC [Lentimonas sp. CC6]CAA7077787.1 Choline-sulfatase (EC [Lentimonas sp. CC4]CAA7169720.1 Choline-sulfatase (EC [Lentimonas sp. CC21]CAA7179542.1 Choline-sulfatase (EC [Lentimonas sp. CC8]
MRYIIPLLLAALSVQLSAAQKPNIILFVTDDHGMDALGCYGNPVIQTPNMDKLAENGVRFTNAYCTSASCAASRSVILTGKYGHATGSYGHVHDYHHFSTFDGVDSLPVLLEAAGYQTARVGKYHVAPEAVYHFDTTLEADPRSTIEMAEACKDVINQDAPFFLYFCPDDPHRGNPFTPEVWSDPNSFGNKTEPYPGETQIKYDPAEVLVPAFMPDSPESRAEIAQYYQSISRIDQGLGKLQTLLEDAGKSENTLIIYISDNGMAFPGAKTTVYEPGIQLPCIVMDPQNDAAGLVNQAMITWADLTPTILDYADVAYSADAFHGRSILPILNESDANGWDEIYASHNFHELTMYYPMRVVRNGDYKLIWNIAYGLSYPFASDLWAASTWQQVHRSGNEYYGNRKVEDFLHRKEFELYDLSNDPNELINLADDPQSAAMLESLKDQIKAFQVRTNDPWYILWSNDASMQGSGVNL